MTCSFQNPLEQTTTAECCASSMTWLEDHPSYIASVYSSWLETKCLINGADPNQVSEVLGAHPPSVQPCSINPLPIGTLPMIRAIPGWFKPGWSFSISVFRVPRETSPLSGIQINKRNPQIIKLHRVCHIKYTYAYINTWFIFNSTPDFELCPYCGFVRC